MPSLEKREILWREPKHQRTRFTRAYHAVNVLNTLRVWEAHVWKSSERMVVGTLVSIATKRGANDTRCIMIDKVSLRLTRSRHSKQQRCCGSLCDVPACFGNQYLRVSTKDSNVFIMRLTCKSEVRSPT